MMRRQAILFVGFYIERDCVHFVATISFVALELAEAAELNY